MQLDFAKGEAANEENLNLCVLKKLAQYQESFFHNVHMSMCYMYTNGGVIEEKQGR